MAEAETSHQGQGLIPRPPLRGFSGDHAKTGRAAPAMARAALSLFSPRRMASTAFLFQAHARPCQRPVGRRPLGYEASRPQAGAAVTTRLAVSISCPGKKHFPAGRYSLWLTSFLIRRVATPVAPQPAVGRRGRSGNGRSQPRRSRNKAAAVWLTSVYFSRSIHFIHSKDL
jgi:hypothetical protein